MTIEADKVEIVRGETARLDGGKYCRESVVWDDGSRERIRTVAPNNTTTYTAYCEEKGCKGAEGSITINVTNSSFYIRVTNGIICEGESTELEVIGCSGWVNWTGGGSGHKIEVNPVTNSVYEATCYVNDVESGKANASVEVLKQGSVAYLQGLTKIKRGEGTTLSAYCGIGGIEWDNQTNASERYVQPTEKFTTYKARCANGRCTGPWQEIIVETYIDGIEIHIPGRTERDSLAICIDQSVRLQATSCNSGIYVWNDGERSTSSFFDILVKETKVYKVVCIDSVYGNSEKTFKIIALNKTTPTIKVTRENEFVGSKVIVESDGCPLNQTVWITGNIEGSIISNRFEFIQNSLKDSVGVFCNSTCASDTVWIESILKDLVIKPEIITKRICDGGKVEFTSGCPSSMDVVFYVNDKKEELLQSGDDLYWFYYNRNNTYKVACESDNGEETTQNVLAIKASERDFSGLIIYPNPFKEVFKISANGCLDGIKIKLYDVEGRIINSELTYVYEEDVLKVFGETLASGNYIIQIIDEEGVVHSTKVIIKVNN